ncbi:MAG: aldo/keto reductase [Treponema sp.]|nr:aldo/keto reductase [Treponema sp.]
MEYRKYGKTGWEVSALSMGCMRLPRIVKDGEAEVDREKAYEMIRYAADNGINYFDSAYGYHNRTSEEVLGEALEGGRREKVRIGTKQPYGVMADLKSGGGKDIYDNARRNLENTLKKLRTSYIDAYLMHGIGSGNWEDIKKNKIIELYETFRSEGLIKAICFSFHGNFATFKDVIEHYDWGMCQVQHNLMDIEKEVTTEGIHLAGQRGIAIVIMEPLRGGSLSTPPEKIRSIYDEFPVKRSGVEWAFRHCIDYPEVSTVLSGMSTLEQLKENIEIFNKPDMKAKCLSAEERDILKRVKAGYESMITIPCTGCNYCMPCPAGVNIPGVFGRFNEANMFGNFDQPRRSYGFMARGKADASHCTGCAACTPKCPQDFDIPEQLKVAHEALAGWVE